MKKIDVYLILIFVIFKLIYRIIDTLFLIHNKLLISLDKYISDILTLYLIYKLYVLVANKNKNV